MARRRRNACFIPPDRDIWVAPASNKSVKAVYVDRIFLVPAG
jgi:hypothetical protein